MEDKRPIWPHAEISEADFRKIHGIGRIKTVEAKWEFTSADTTRDWLEATSASDKKVALPENWENVLEFVGHASVPGLFKYTYFGERCLKTMQEIDAWEKKNEQDRAEYERLKEKFST